MVLTTAEAAQQLGVSTHEIRRLIAAGDLAAEAAGRVWLVDEDSVRQRARSRVRRGRALAPATAWAALFEASGARASWLDDATRSRLRSWLRRHDAESIAAACRHRADRHDLRVLPAYRERLLATAGVVAGGVTAAVDAGADLVLMSNALTEVYCDTGTFERLTRQYGLAAVGTPNLLVRIPRHEVHAVLRAEGLPRAVVAVDLIDASDVRTRRAGTDLLTSLVREHVGVP